MDPNFFLIGAAKAGTTSLYMYLSQHPEIYMSSQKETHYFAFKDILLANMEFSNSEEEKYVKKIYSLSVTDEEVYTALFAKVTTEKAIGEASTSYLHFLYPDAAKKIHDNIPDAKLIAILRNPVERAFSAFLYFVREGIESITDFSAAIQSENWRRDRYLRVGFYYEALTRYYELFESDQMRIYLYEDLKKDPCGLMQDIFHFLDVDEAFVPEMSIKFNVSGIPKSRVLHNLIYKTPKAIKTVFNPIITPQLNRAIRRLSYHNLYRPKLNPDVRRMLQDMYREDILKVQDMIDRDLSDWLDVS